MMRAKVRRTSSALWYGTPVIVRGAVRAPVTGSARGAETVLEPATGEGGPSLVKFLSDYRVYASSAEDQKLQNCYWMDSDVTSFCQPLFPMSKKSSIVFIMLVCTCRFRECNINCIIWPLSLCDDDDDDDVSSFSHREGKYIPLPQRQREMNRERERAERGPGGPPPHNRLSGGYRSNPPSSSSPRPPLPSAAGPQSGASTERNSPLSGRGGAYAPHHPQGSPSPGPGSGPAGGPAQTSASASAAPSPASPPASHGHTVPHSHSLPHSLSEAGRPVNGGECMNLCQKVFKPHLWMRFGWMRLFCAFQSLPEHLLKPKDLHSRVEQSELQTHTRSPQVLSVNYRILFCSVDGFSLKLNLSCLVLAATRSPKSSSSQDPPYLDTSSVSLPAQKTSGPAPLFPVDGTVSPPVFVLSFVLNSKSKPFSCWNDVSFICLNETVSWNELICRLSHLHSEWDPWRCSKRTLGREPQQHRGQQE